MNNQACATEPRRQQSQKSLEDRLTAIELMLAAILEKVAGPSLDNLTRQEFIAHHQAKGIPATDIIKLWNRRGKS